MATIEDYVNKLRLANRIYNSLTTNKYSRDTPTNAFQLISRIRESLMNDDTVKLMLLWGGSKEGICGDEADKRSLDFLSGIQDELRDFHSQSQWYLLFCDMHHVLANGRNYEETTDYYSCLVTLVQERGLEMVRLSDLLGDKGIETYTDINSRIRAQDIINDPKSFEKLKEGAKKHSRYTDKFAVEDIARVYMEVEIYFLQKIDEIYPNQIFCSFSDPNIQKPIAEAAQVPMLHLHSAGKGHHECPWYSGGQGDYI